MSERHYNHRIETTSEPVDADPDNQGAGNSRIVPHWNAQERCLYFNSELVKEFRQSAENQTIVLEAFELSGWTTIIENPLPVVPYVDRIDQLYETVKSLNQCQRNTRIRFHTTHQGTAIRWHPKE